MTEIYYVIKQNTIGKYLLDTPNEILLKTNNKDVAITRFRILTGDKVVHPSDLNKGVYKVVSLGHYKLYPKTLYEVVSNTLPV